MPRRLLRDGVIVEDEWRTCGDGEVRDDAPLILTFAEWQAERDRWLSRSGRLGVVLAPADEVERLVPLISRGSIWPARHFPGPSEGRGYTQGRLLRERFGFVGELRARGAIGEAPAFLSRPMRLQR